MTVYVYEQTIGDFRERIYFIFRLTKRNGTNQKQITQTINEYESCKNPR